MPGYFRNISASLRGLFSLLRIRGARDERVDAELSLARRIQFSLVPDNFPPYSAWREFDLYSLLSPAKEVGGDYYDFFMPDSRRLVLTVGDVSGKGMPAALYMAVSRTAFRALARHAVDPGTLLTDLNDMLVRDNHSGLYVTIACFFIDLPTGKCQYAIAGHPAPLLRRAASGDAELLDQPRETFAGLREELTFPVGELQMQRGDTLLLYSDGVTETRNPDGVELEYEGLRACFVQAAEEERCRNLIERMARSLCEYRGDEVQNDDITLLAFRYWGPGGQKAPQSRDTSSVRVIFGDPAHRTPAET